MSAIRILLIEDDDDDRIIIEDLLSDIDSCEYEVDWVTNARDGIAALAEREHDVCLLDYRLGAETGLVVLEHASDAVADVPCILLTGTDNRETDRNAMNLGAVDYLVKGTVDEEALERAIRYAAAQAESRRQLRLSEQRFRSVFEATHDGIAVFDQRGIVDCANPAACDMFGFDTEGFHGRHFSELLANTEVEPVAARFMQWDEQQLVRINNIESVGRRTDGSTFPLAISASSFMHDGERFWSALLRDTSVTTELLDQLAHQTLHDRLTGLPNRALLQERIERSLHSMRRTGAQPAVIVVDVDNFKRVNDVHGHEIGDLALKEVARRLKAVVPVGETVGRIGSDEFALLVEGHFDTRGVIRFAERVRHAVRETIDLDGIGVNLTCSAGIALLSDPDCRPETALRNADVAMYAAKANGRDRVEVFDEAMYCDLLDVISLDQDLRAALREGDITAHYQPIVCLETGEIRSVEALARWHHPDRGWVRPDVFVHAAERSGAIGKLGELILGHALATARRLPNDVSVAVNVSSHQLRDHRFATTVESMLAKEELDGNRLVVEVTESVLVGDIEATIRQLDRLRQLGVRVALDDFGTGYSSLAYLRRLPIDELKLDRSFVQTAAGPKSRALVQAVATIAESFDIPSVAEGIETDESRDLMRSLGFTLGQGYFFAKPMAADDIVEHVTKLRFHHA